MAKILPKGTVLTPKTKGAPKRVIAGYNKESRRYQVRYLGVAGVSGSFTRKRIDELFTYEVNDDGNS